MRKEIIFGEEPLFVAHSSNKIVREKKELKPKDNSRKIASLQKKIEKMQSSGLWNMPYTYRRQRFLDGYTYEIEKLQKQIEELGGTGGVDIQKQKLDQKIKAQLLKKIPGYFPTPKEVVKKMVEYAEINDLDLVLEPSCGTGAIIDGIREISEWCNIIGIELNYSNFQILQEKYTPTQAKLINNDFIEESNSGIGPFDKIIMNPPFENKQDQEHILRAFSMLNKGGILVAICSAGFQFRDDYQILRDLVSRYGIYIDKLDSGTFKLSGTMVNSVLLVLKK